MRQSDGMKQWKMRIASTQHVREIPTPFGHISFELPIRNFPGDLENWDFFEGKCIRQRNYE